MTDAERAVIAAARAYERLWTQLQTEGPVVFGLASALDVLLAAVRALPRPLSEQLAELRAGAVVDSGPDGNCYRVLANIPSHDVLACEYMAGDEVHTTLVDYRHITRIISNPEADRG